MGIWGLIDLVEDNNSKDEKYSSAGSSYTGAKNNTLDIPIENIPDFEGSVNYSKKIEQTALAPIPNQTNGNEELQIRTKDVQQQMENVTYEQALALVMTLVSKTNKSAIGISFSVPNLQKHQVGQNEEIVSELRNFGKDPQNKVKLKVTTKQQSDKKEQNVDMILNKLKSAINTSKNQMNNKKDDRKIPDTNNREDIKNDEGYYNTQSAIIKNKESGEDNEEYKWVKEQMQNNISTATTIPNYLDTNKTTKPINTHADLNVKLPRIPQIKITKEHRDIDDKNVVQMDTNITNEVKQNEYMHKEDESIIDENDNDRTVTQKIRSQTYNSINNNAETQKQKISIEQKKQTDKKMSIKQNNPRIKKDENDTQLQMDLGGFGAPIIKPKRKIESQIKEQDELFQDNDENDMNMDKMYGKDDQEDEKKEDKDDNKQENAELHKDDVKSWQKQNNEIDESRSSENIDIDEHEKLANDEYKDLKEDENIQTHDKNVRMHDEARRRVPTASSGVSLIRQSIPKLDPQRNQRLYTGVGAPTALAVDRVAGSLTQFEDETSTRKEYQEKKDELEQSPLIRTSFDNYYGFSYKDSEIEPVKPTNTKYDVKGQIDELLADKKEKTQQRTSEKKINNMQKRTASKTQNLQEKRITNSDEQIEQSDEKELQRKQKIVNSAQSNRKSGKLTFEKPNIFDTSTIRSSLNKPGAQKHESDKKIRITPLAMKDEISEMKKNDVEQEQIPEKNIVVKIDDKQNRKENLISGFLEMLKKPNKNIHTAEEKKKINEGIDTKDNYTYSKNHEDENAQDRLDENEYSKTQLNPPPVYTPKAPIYSTTDTEIQVQRMIRKDNVTPKKNLNEQNVKEQKTVENSDEIGHQEKQLSEYENERQNSENKNDETQDRQIKTKKTIIASFKKPKNNKVINNKQMHIKSRKAHIIHDKKAMTKIIEIGDWKFKPEEIKPVAKTNKTKKEDNHLQNISQYKNKQEYETGLNEIKNRNMQNNSSDNYKEKYTNSKLGYRLGLIKSEDKPQVDVDQATNENKDNPKSDNDSNATKTQNYTQTPSIPQIGPQKIVNHQKDPIDELENVAQDMIKNKANLQKQTTKDNDLNEKPHQENKTQEQAEQKNVSEQPVVKSKEKTEQVQKPVVKPGLFSSLANRLGINKNNQTQASDLTQKQSNQLNTSELKSESMSSNKNIKNKNIITQQNLNSTITKDANEKNNQEQNPLYNVDMSKKQQEQTADNTPKESQVDEADTPVKMAQDKIKEQTPKTENIKEDKDITDELLIAYSKENCRWLYQIYAMGGMSIEDFRDRVISRMHGIDEKDDESDSNKEQNAQTKAVVTDKKFKK